MRTGVGSAPRRAGIAPGDVTAPIVHATTLITNALIEGKTGRAGLVTTQGFGDTLLIRDEHRYDMYDLQIEFPAPPIPRDRTFEIAERTAASGSVCCTVRPRSAGTRSPTNCGPLDVESVGICLLNSYVNADQRADASPHIPRA